MAGEPSPTIRRRELAARLRQLRLDAGLTIDEVAGRLLVSATKISRLETGARPVSLRDVRDLSEMYQLSDTERRHLLQLAHESRRSSWWQQYGAKVSEYVGLEAAASSISDYRSAVIPGLLQTEGYGLAVAARTASDDDPAARETAVRIRLTRQAILTQERAPQFDVVLDEAVLRRVVGDSRVMHDQLRKIIDCGALPNVTVQVIPFIAGAHPGMDSTFTILHFEESVTDVIYVEGMIGALYLKSPADVTRYWQAFEQLRRLALDPGASLRLLEEAARFFDTESATRGEGK